MEDPIKILRFTGWHGTDEVLATQILKSNFQKSEGEHHWLGEGAYFFTKGIGNPVDHARNWVKSEAFKTGCNKYAILKADVVVRDDVFLDLTTEAGLELFQEHKRFVLSRLRQSFKSKNENYTDGKVFEHMKQQAGIEVTIAHMYVRFGQNRIEKINSRIPNCTFLCIAYPDENIITKAIVERGNI